MAVEYEIVIIIAVNKVESSGPRVVCHPVTCLCLPVDEGLILIYLSRACYIVATSSGETTSRRFVFAGNSFSDLLLIQSS